MKRFLFPGVMSIVLLGVILIATTIQPPSASAQCYEIVGGGDGIVVPCPDNDTGDEDSDGDGIINREDNCAAVPNPDQLNTWGGFAGDACEASYTGNGGGAVAFPQYDGTYTVYGDCYTDDLGQIQCRQLAQLDVCNLSDTDGSSAYVPTSASGTTQRVLVTLMERSNTHRVYQINIQDANGVNLGNAFNIRFDNVNCPQLAPPPPAPTDSDGDGFLDLFDYCPTTAGSVEGCPTVAAYHAALTALGIDYQNVFNTSNSSSSNTSSCGGGGEETNLGGGIWVDASDAGYCGGDLSSFDYIQPYTLTSGRLYINEEFCSAIYYQHEICRAWADDDYPYGDSPSSYNTIYDWCVDYLGSECYVSWHLYCSVMDDPALCGYASFDQFCTANSGREECDYFNACVADGYPGAVCPYVSREYSCTYNHSTRRVVCDYGFEPGVPVSLVPADVQQAYCEAFNDDIDGCPVS